ncbi:MAG: SusC/RagA family TonB-linked outer membrane protein, partial [Ferruginibacter sp.]|nr:SusC/RagA family TonB-linked outer membrane protein [Cytophagales bacterium]
MKTRVLIGLLFFLATHSFAQTDSAGERITGRVTSAKDRSALPGVSVSVKGSTQGTVTDAEGRFALAVPPAGTLVFSYIGYLFKEVIVKSGSNGVDVALEEDAKELSELVVVGYGQQTRQSLTGSVASVTAADIRDIPVPSTDQLLQGKTTGVQVTANSGVPGGGIFIRVRGTNSVNAGNDPLYVIDGVFINNTNLITTGLGNQVASNPLADLNPADIESIQVLKDANATAIYGSRGANGVVLITTKRGKVNARSRINFSTYQGWSQAAKKYEVVTGPQLAELENERHLNDGGDPTRLPFPNPADEPTYDRISDLFRTARTSDYELSVTGGNEKTTFYVGGGYFRQESVVQPSNFERYSARVNLDHFFSDRLKVGTSNALARTGRNVSSNDNNPTGVINSGLYPRSNLPVFNTDGSYALYGNFDNHLALINHLNNDAVGHRVISNVYAEYTFFEGLSLRSSWSIDFNDAYENNYTNTFISAGRASQGRAVSALTRDITLLNEQVLSYRKEFGERHRLYALVGNTIQKNTFGRTTLNGQQFPSNDFQTIASSATQTGSSSRSAAGLVSYFGKVNYSYLNRYSLEGSLRADASSRFGA